MAFRVRAGSQVAMLREHELVMGRSSYCSLVLEDPSVSRVHAALRRTSDGLEIVDLGSKHGTFVRDRRVVAPVLLHPGDKVMLGRVQVHLEQVHREEAHTTPDDLELLSHATLDLSSQPPALAHSEPPHSRIRMSGPSGPKSTAPR